MSVWGKIIGGVAGFAVGGPIGALLGAVAGHAVDKYREEKPADEAALLGHRRGAGWGRGADPAQEQAARQTAFSVAVVVLGAKMAKVDGAVSRIEVDAFKEVFRVPPSEMKTVGRIFDAARQQSGGFEPYARQVATLFRSEPQVLEQLLSGLYHIARADGPIKPAETAFLYRVAEIFGLDAAAIARASASGRGGMEPAGPDPYQMLGLARGATDEQIKQTYRRLVRENHPDALIAKGMPEDCVALANEKLSLINAAYDRIAHERGLR
ncbi:MAG: TerB family tellurite resistance protein [Rhodospirillales bacterium]|jgi:DnaJ like chaperone protein|nr:TerB family tellurite resistance protein [Rhodospirillales bacterium]